MSSAHIMTTVRTFSGLILAHFYLSCALGADNRKFPPDFKFGVATAAYQIEGAWNEDGKGENMWDHLTHTRPEVIEDQSNADVACDSYHKYETDIDLLKELGVDFYRFSLSWSRILPTGDITGGINVLGVKYYDNILNLLQENGIEAMVTLYHLDLPQPLQENFGGWLNESIVNIFVDYARLAFDLFGNRVKYWMTFNEPNYICQLGNQTGWKIPVITDNPDGIDIYVCGHNVLKSHAAAYHIYDNFYRHEQQGKVSMGLSTGWIEPASDDPLDLEAADRFLQFCFGWFANPIVHGNYPQVMIDRIGARSLQEGFEQSRLPEFTNHEIEYIKGTYDYIGINHYSTIMVQWIEDIPIGDPSVSKDLSAGVYQNETWENSTSVWLKVVPWGMRKMCKWTKDTYNNPEIIITENGFSDVGVLDDERRINYITEYLSSLLEAIYDDEVKVTGYTVWTLMDDFEYFRGYLDKFGLYSVNFSDPNRHRTPKASANYYKNVVATRCIVDTCRDHDLHIGAPNESLKPESNHEMTTTGPQLRSGVLSFKPSFNEVLTFLNFIIILFV